MLSCRCVWSSGYTWMPPNPATTQPSNTSCVASVPRIVHHLSLEMQREAAPAAPNPFLQPCCCGTRNAFVAHFDLSPFSLISQR